jgi:hypothetical protein
MPWKTRNNLCHDPSRRACDICRPTKSMATNDCSSFLPRHDKRGGFCKSGLGVGLDAMQCAGWDSLLRHLREVPSWEHFEIDLFRIAQPDWIMDQRSIPLDRSTPTKISASEHRYNLEALGLALACEALSQARCTYESYCPPRRKT